MVASPAFVVSECWSYVFFQTLHAVLHSVMSTVTLFSLHIILLKSLKNLISLLFSIIFHRPYVYPDNGTPIFLLKLYPHFPPSFQLYCPWPVSGDRNIEADIYCGVGNKGKEADAAGRNILSDWLNAFLFLLYVHFSLCSSALQFASLVVTSAWFLFFFAW